MKEIICLPETTEAALYVLTAEERAKGEWRISASIEAMQGQKLPGSEYAAAMEVKKADRRGRALRGVRTPEGLGDRGP